MQCSAARARTHPTVYARAAAALHPRTCRTPSTKSDATSGGGPARPGVEGALRRRRPSGADTLTAATRMPGTPPPQGCHESAPRCTAPESTTGAGASPGYAAHETFESASESTSGEAPR